ncbi:MAG: radical SAM protein [Deltaproteobacteria bacterium]|nr:radical SAM protein [Deltaproteobacteria bacterium]
MIAPVRTLWRGFGRRGPLYAMVQVTARCNLRCRMCQVWTLEHQGGEELPTRRYPEMARIFSEAGIQVVTLAGEPFLRDDLAEIVAAFAERGLSVRIQSNGTLVTRERADAVVAAGLRGISISLHSLDPARMAWIEGREGVLDEVLAGVEAIRAATRGRRRFLRFLNAVLFQGNLEEIPALVTYAARQGFRLSVSPVHVSSLRTEERQFVPRLGEGLALRPEDRPRLEAVSAFLLEQRRHSRTVLNSSAFLRMLPRYVDGEPLPWSCLAGTLYAFVDHLGRVAACHDLPPVGSVFDPEVIRTLVAGDLGGRSRADRAACPGCLLPCWTELSLLFSHPGAFLEGVEANLPRVRAS